MREHNLDYTFPIAPRAFWQLFLLDDDFRAAFYEHLALDLEHLDIKTHGEGDDLVIERDIEMTPHRDLPGFLKKALSGASKVRERGRYSARERKYEVEIVLPVIGRRVDFRGVYTWADSDHETRRTWRATCNARIPLFGGKLESFLLGQVEDSHQRGALFTERYIKEKL